MLSSPDIKALVDETERWFRERKHLMLWDEGPRQRLNVNRKDVMREYRRHQEGGTAELLLADMEARTLAGQGDWDFALRTVAADYVVRGEPVPEVLRRYTRKVLHGTFPPPPSKKKGQHKGSNFSRDILIVDRIAFIERTYGISPTKNDATDKDCGCSIVATALIQADIPKIKTMGAVMTIWQNRVVKR